MWPVDVGLNWLESVHLNVVKLVYVLLPLFLWNAACPEIFSHSVESPTQTYFILSLNKISQLQPLSTLFVSIRLATSEPFKPQGVAHE